MGLSALAFSICPLFYAIALDYTNAVSQALFVQVAITICAGIVLVASLGSARMVVQATRHLFALPFETWIVIVLSGIGAYIGTLFFMFALGLMSKAGAAIIMESWPILAVFIAPVLIPKKWKKFQATDFVLMILLMLGLVMISAGEAGLSLSQFIQNPLFMVKGGGFNELYGVICALLCALCYAWAGVARPYFVSLLPDEYRTQYFGGLNTWKESLFAFWITAAAAIPLALVTVLLFGIDVSPPVPVLLPTLGLGIALTTMGCTYALSLTLADTPNVNFLWYLSPLLAAIWLALFGYTQITLMLVAGGILIILANAVLIVNSRPRKVPAL